MKDNGNKEIAFILIVAFSIFIIFVIMMGAIKQKNNFQKIQQLLDKLESVQNETLEMLNK